MLYNLTNMKNLKMKLKKTSKTLRIFFFVVFIIYTISTGFMTRGLLLLEGIETFLRIVIIATLMIILIIYLISGLVLLILKKKGLIITVSIFIAILSIINFAGYYLVSKGYNFLSTINTPTIKYTTNLVTLKETNKIVKVGMIDTETDVEGYILPKEYMLNNNLKYEIEKYEDYYFLLADLYHHVVDAIFISGNYVNLYSSSDDYKNIEEETKVVATYSKEMEKEELSETTNKSITDPFSVLIIGIDSKHDGLKEHSAFNGDTLMLVTFNPKTLSATMFSIPRDTYVPIACLNNRKYKINAAAAYGTKCMLNTIEKLVGFQIDYTAKINFKGLVGLVDALGGIEVDVPKPDFPSNYCTDDSNRKNKGSICLTPGKQILDGEHALALARNRKAFALSDFKRIQNQQLVVEAIARKAKTIRNIQDFSKVLDTISRNLDTNMATKEILNFYNVGKNILVRTNFSENEFFNIQRTYLTGYDSTIYKQGYAFQYYEESLKEIINALLVNLEVKEPTIIKTFNFSANKPYEIEIIGKKYTSGTREETLPNFVGQSYGYIENWSLTKNIEITRIDRESTTCNNNEVLEQNISKGILLSSIKTLKIVVCKNNTTTNQPTTNSEPPTE